MKPVPADTGFKTAVLVFFFLFLPGILQANYAVLPINMDYTLLRSIMVSQLFSGPDNRIELTSDSGGCVRIIISDPVFSEENSVLKFEIKVHMTASLDFAGKCFIPFEWEGYVVFFQTPAIDPDNWTLSFKTQDSIVLDKAHKPQIITGTVWKIIRGKVHTFVDGIRIDLTPTVDDLKSFLADMFPEDLQFQAEQMTQSMAPGNINILSEAVQIGINTDISSIYNSERISEEAPLSDEELTGFTRTWETMDAYIVYIISTLARNPLNDDERDLVLETLLETRYRFIDELSGLSHETDFVRNQFMIVWNRLSDVFKRHMGNDPTASPLRALAFLSAMDALKTLDSIGPAIGIEISRNGLIRLARLISTEKAPDLFYSMEMDETLRQMLGMDPELKESPVPMEDKPDDSYWNSEKLSEMMLRWIGLYSEAHAADPTHADAVHPEHWLPDPSGWFEYVKNVRQVLDNASDKTISKNSRDPEYADLFRLITGAVAWQESCFRQFKANKGKIGYLRSYNNTSVGIMQINERVWRGIYDPEKLRWNIYYNVDAGCEIADLYLNRYIFRKMQKNDYPLLENKDNIARTLYALYNGGPGEFSKFLDRISENKFYLSDKLFYEKYLWVKNDQWEKARICLIGE